MSKLASLLPQKLATQLLMVLILALVTAFAIAILLTLNIQRVNDRTTRDQYAVERVAELTATIEALSLERRQQFAKAARTHTTSIKVENEPAVLDTAGNARSDNLADAVMSTINRTDIRVAVLSRSEFEVEGDPRDSGRNREVIAISIPLEPQGWLNFNSREPLSWYTQADQQFLFVVFGISLLSVSGFAWFFVRKITLPVEEIANAARRAANGDRSARVQAMGPVEMTAAATAFNSMQDQIQQAEAERVRTVAALGHDLRTPITSLRVRAELIDNDEIRLPMSATLDQMIVMADGLVEYARSKRVEEFIEQLDLHALVSDISTEYDVPFVSDVYPTIAGGPVSISRALRNLLDNANRYAKLKSVTLETRNNDAVISVWDEGPGIDESMLESIVEPFVRGDSSRNAETGGHGLGLTITREIVNSHGGQLALQNYEDKGLCASIVIPLPAANSANQPID